MWKWLVILFAYLCMSFDSDKAVEYVWMVNQSGATCAGTTVKYAGKKYVLTAWHCVDDGTEVTVDGEPVKIIRSNIARDLSLLEAPKHLTKFTVVQPKLPKPGTWVWLFGFPDREFTLSHATIATPCLDRNKYRLFKLDGSIDKGSSGGPVFNDQHEVIGVVNLMYGKFGFAVCPDEIIRLLEDK